MIERSKTLAEKQEEALQNCCGASEGGCCRCCGGIRTTRFADRATEHPRQCDTPTTTEELSDLAEAVLQAIHPTIEAEMREAHGTPLNPDGTPATFAIVAMGKFGGRELNFSSDLDVMYVYSEDGETTKGMPNVEYFSAVGLALVNRLAGNGMGIYEVDLRLRPYGTGGAIALSLSGYQNYYDNTGEVWERQALTRARVVAGDIQGGWKPIFGDCTRLLLWRFRDIRRNRSRLYIHGNGKRRKRHADLLLDAEDVVKHRPRLRMSNLDTAALSISNSPCKRFNSYTVEVHRLYASKIRRSRLRNCTTSAC